MQGRRFDSWWRSYDCACLEAKNQNIKWKQYCSKFSKDFLKSDPHQNNFKKKHNEISLTHLSSWLKCKRLKIPSIDENFHFSSTDGRNISYYNHLGNILDMYTMV